MCSGVAIGAGAHVSVESAHVVLMGGQVGTEMLGFDANSWEDYEAMLVCCTDCAGMFAN